MDATNDAGAFNVTWWHWGVDENDQTVWVAERYPEKTRFPFVQCMVWRGPAGMWHTLVKQMDAGRNRIRAQCVTGTEATAKKAGEAMLRCLWRFAVTEA